MTGLMVLTPDLINSWATDPNGPVALHLKQELLPVEGKGGVIFPPTYADIGYNIDTLADGTKVATIDSVGSQANRMEPIFKQPPYDALVPQIEIELHRKDEDNRPYIEKRSLLDLAHRSADAVVLSCPTLAPDISKAFRALKQHGDAGPLCRLAPTSLVFGVWDSRGGSGEKIPRLVRSIIRAWDVQPLHAAAQFNSVWKALDAEQQDELQKEAKAKKVKLSEKGFADAPAIFRKFGESAGRHIPEFREGSPNLERRVLGGVLSRGRIEREVTVNLVALRRFGSINDEESTRIRRYLLALTLIAATAEIELFLREGCHLRFASDDIWNSVPRRGGPTIIDLLSENAHQVILDYATTAVQPFRTEWPQDLVHKFDIKAAKKIIAKKTEDEGTQGES